MKKIILLLFLIATLTNAQIERSSWNSAKTDLWASPVGGAILNGTSQYYSYPDNANLNFGTGDFSVEWYGKLVATSTGYYLVSKSGASGGYFILNTTNTGLIQALISDGTTSKASLATNEIDTDEPVHIIASINKTDFIRIYINSIEVGYTTKEDISSVVSVSNSYDLNIGRKYNNTFWDNGNIYFAKTHNYALSQSEVIERWNNGQPHLFVEPYATRDVSNTERILATANQDFSSWTGNWAGWLTGAVADGTGKMTLTLGASGTTGCTLSTTYITAPVIGKKYKVSIDIWKGTTALNAISIQFGGTTLTNKTITGTQATISGEVTAISTAGLFIFSGASDAGTIFIDNVSIIPQGNTFSALPQDCGTNGWKVKVGGEISVMNGTANPIAVSRNYDGRQGVSTSEVVMTNSQSKNTKLIGFNVIDKSGSANTVTIGTTTGGTDIANAVAVSANSTKWIDVNELALTARTFYVKAGGASLIIIPHYEEF